MQALIDWAPMSKQTFEGHVADVEAGRVARVHLMDELLDELLTSPQEWSDDVFIAVVSGAYGPSARSAAVQVVTDGFKDGGAILSFTRMCIRHGRMGLLASVAALGLPEQLRGPGVAYVGSATTDAGRWLDALANINQAGPATSFARQVVAFASSAAGRDLARILVEHDPNHADIEALQGSAGYFVITEALMLRRIAMAAQNPEPATSGRASRRAGL